MPTATKNLRARNSRSLAAQAAKLEANGYVYLSLRWLAFEAITNPDEVRLIRRILGRR